MKDRDICLVTGADNRYAKPLAVMLKSAQMNLAPEWTINAFIMDGGVSRGNRARIERSLDKKRIAVQWIQMKQIGELHEMPVFGHVTVATYFRVLLGDILPASCEKAIYLDADTVVLQDLSVLWRIDMQGKILLAVQEGMVTVSTGDGLPEYEALGIPADTPLFNAGVFVVDLDKWRRADVSRKVLKYLKRNYDHVMYWDQDGLNAILSCEVSIIPKSWNYRVDCHESFPESVVDTIKKNAAVVHYASSEKPWHYYATHPGKKFFFEYIDHTVWAGWRPSIPLKALRNRHFWGIFVRNIPLVGSVWARWRCLHSHKSKMPT